ncbi:SOS response-associated peptidase family protein [Dyella acidiphila]|uniref:SOS response-associated peptidase family protein n=1 Tax=Dyella acidiphila TaxID=2775866 RepID=A0ABR9GA31_9GAMM|nr:SOS response-associated peptidase family protein [Dyella acidiphila]MBE1160900.1 SOS response-associated peptidase family protein [Dyella acidiphila]
MCYSAQIYADFRKYEHLGGTPELREFALFFEERKKKGDWMKRVPKPMRDAFNSPSNESEREINDIAQTAYKDAVLELEAEITALSEHLMKAMAAQTSINPSNMTHVGLLSANSKISKARAKLAALGDKADADGLARIWFNSFCPLLIRSPGTGQRSIVPMRYQCRLPGWTTKDEWFNLKTKIARREELFTEWRQLFGHNHGVIVARRFDESVPLHRMEQREQDPDESESNVVIKFEPDPEQDLLLACLWNYTEASENAAGFYSFAIIKSEPPPEVSAAGSDQCVIAIKPENLEAWLNPHAHTLNDMIAILDHPVEVHFKHEVL